MTRAKTKTARTTKIEEPNWALYNSVERPRAVVDWLLDHSRRGTSNDDLGPLFWKIVKERWSIFDLVEHDMFGIAFARFRPYWKPQPELKRLPQQFTIWRGGDRYRVRKGLSWTMDRSVAEGFAIGHRLIFNKYPTLLCAEVNRDQVALVVNDRDEKEVILFAPLLGKARREPISKETIDRMVPECLAKYRERNGW